MTLTARELAVNVTSTATWTQMQEDGSNYEVPASSRSDIKNITAVNLHASNSVIVDFAISADGSIGDVERVGYSVTLAAGAYVELDTVRIMNAAKRLYVRATGTTPNVTFRCALLERAL